MKNSPTIKKASLVLAIGGVAALLYTGCMTDSKGTAAKTAMAMLTSTGAAGSNGARGTVNFTAVTGGVHVVGSFQGLTPGVHGFHVHANGSCDSMGNAAGGHFNPMNMPHGLPDSAMHHMGDLGNITAGADSMASIDQVVSYLTLDSVNTIVGHALIVHALPDMGTQPTGAAGARVSCGVISAGSM